MNQRLFHSLTVAVFASAVSTALPSHAESAEQLERLFHGIGDTSDVLPKSLNPLEPVVSSDELASEADAESQAASTPTPAPAATSVPDAASNASRATPLRNSPRLSLNVITHPLDGRQAATLYVQSIPVLTFLGPELPTLNDGKVTPEAEDPTTQAQDVADALGAFYDRQGNAEQIQVRWDGDRETYVIALGETELLAFHEAVMLPDTTRNPGQDALQATNRLRRLIGQVAPLDTIPGLPVPAAPAQAPEPSPTPAVERVVSITTGRASWYGPGFHGRRTASGEVFNQNALTAAHRTLPFGTQVRVTNLSNNRQIIVRINDRGPFTGGRIIDLSAGAARAVGLHSVGVGTVRLEVVEIP